MAVPGSIRDTLSARMDRLSHGARRALEAAAVFSGQVSLTTLEEMLGQPDELLEHVQELVREEFLREHPAPSTSEYAFKHALRDRYEISEPHATAFSTGWGGSCSSSPHERHRGATGRHPRPRD